MSDARSDNAKFEPTRWSLVLRARAVDDSVRREALGSLCRAYWYPLYAFLRRSGREVEDAQDLTQDFFARLMDGSLLASAALTQISSRSYVTYYPCSLMENAAFSLQDLIECERYQRI
jgi:hypothetical protein